MNMRHIKKGLAILIALAALFSLSACDLLDIPDALRPNGSEEKAEAVAPTEPDVLDPYSTSTLAPAEAELTEEPVDTEEPEEAEEPETPDESEITPPPTEEPTDAEEPAEEPTDTEEPTEEPADAEEPAEEPVERIPVSVLGCTEGDTYTNEYFDLVCTLDGDWAFYTEEELMQMQASAAERVGDTSFGQYTNGLLDESTSLYTMAAYGKDGLQNMNVVVEKLPALGSHLTEADLVELAFGKVGVSKDDFAAMGLEGIVMERNTYELAGQEHSGVLLRHVDTSLGINIPIYQQMVFLLQEDYYIQITMTGIFEDTAIPTMAGFFAPLSDGE